MHFIKTHLYNKLIRERDIQDEIRNIEMIVGYLLKSFCFGKKSIARELKTIAETRNEMFMKYKHTNKEKSIEIEDR